MSSHAQPDLFADLEPEAKGGRKPISYAPDPDKVRAELIEVLGKARAAETMPWDARKTLYWRVVFPQMCNWLPAEERDRMRAEFAAELQRLDAA